MHSRRAEVGVDQQGALAELGKDDGEVGREIGATLAALGTENRQHLALLGPVEPAQHQLAADRAQLLDARAERLIRGDDLVAQAALLARHLAQVGVGELARQRELDVGFADEA